MSRAAVAARGALAALALAALPGARAQFHPVPVPAAGQVVGEQSTMNGAATAMWGPTAPLAWGADFASAKSLTVARASRAQPMIGFGAAYTDTAAWNVRRMNATTRAAFLEATFGATGSGWTLMRVTINSADYSFQVRRRAVYVGRRRRRRGGNGRFVATPRSAARIPARHNHRTTRTTRRPTISRWRILIIT